MKKPNKTASKRIQHTREMTIEGKKLWVFDDCLPEKFVESFNADLIKCPYVARPSFDNELSCGFTPEEVRQIPQIYGLASELVKKYSKMSSNPIEQHFSHAYASAIRFGDSTQIHQDIPCDDCLTILYYSNLSWSGDWGGETVFYDSNRDAVGCIGPRPGRILLFNAAIFHRAGVPMRNAPTFRYTFSMFYRCQKQIDLAQKRVNLPKN
jgi:SM-20-related protein